MKKVIFLGGGGHARSVMDIALDNDDFEITGCVAPDGEGTLGVPVIGNDDDLTALYQSGIRHAFVALGDNRLRKKLSLRLLGIGFELINVVSKNAVISGRATLADGICVMPGAVVNAGAVIGSGCIVNTNCSIDHDCEIGAYCHIAPGAALSGMVRLGEGVHIGTGGSVIDQTTIGAWSYVGAGAAVVCDLPGGVMAYGVPAKEIRKL